MFGRGLMGLLLTGGIVVALNYFMKPKRRSRFMFARSRWPMSQKNMMQIGKWIVRAVNR